MRGDFSSWRDEQRKNFVGVLHQQGRVLLDADWNAQTELTSEWQDTAGMDIIGAGVAAIPASQPDALMITAAELKSAPNRVELTVNTGRVWADGLPYELDGPTPTVKRTAIYLQPPVQDPTAAFPVIPSSPETRDAVILEVWREELNAFQLPDLLFEPALGDPDTTERVLTSAAFRLFRLNAGETCESIIGRLADNFNNKGKLTVTLQPTSMAGTTDCPLAVGGGYTGFEHNLYRIEVADVDAATPMFKWSQYNGGIVGSGKFNSGVSPRTINIHANLQAIINSGLTSCYLEALEFDPSPVGDLGHWRVSYGARATVGADGVITLNNATIFGAVPTTTRDVFFRLWNGIELISAFSGSAVPLQDGIQLNFDAVASGKYAPRDYWTFAVRAGEIANDPVLINHKPPQGIHYHRVPLAELTWTASTSATIEDCRRVFQPLTRLATCCTYRVGDGVHSHGDFTSIQAAINHLPAAGGEICVLPGDYEENVRIRRRQNITIKGCGRRSRVFSRTPPGGAIAAPVFQIIASQNISIQSLKIEAHDTGVGVLVAGPDLAQSFKDAGRFLPARDITLENLLVSAATRSAIEVEVAFQVTIRRCRIEMKDVPSLKPGIFLIGEDALLEENVVLAVTDGSRIKILELTNPFDPDLPLSAHKALGGVQIGGGSDRVRIINNVIMGGIGNGITLGSLRTIDANGDPLPEEPDPEPDPCDPCKDGDNSIPPKGDGGTRTISAGELYHILIERNRIFRMGLNGIGVVGFFNVKGQDAEPEIITVNSLRILGNDIRKCVSRPLRNIAAGLQGFMGYGGISLASVLDLFVRDNYIEDNGLDFVNPICGIFLLHGEGVEISRNVIRNNGARALEPPSAARPGPRGGIFLATLTAPTFDFSPTSSRRIATLSNGTPALKVQENIVSAPLGRALTAFALGAVSVVGNQFTSLEIEPGTIKVSTVLIFNVGQSIDFQDKSANYTALNSKQKSTPARLNLTAAEAPANRPGSVDAVAPAPPEQFLNGTILFTNNQCLLEGLERPARSNATVNQSFDFEFAASIAIVTSDDIGFHNNQSECLIRTRFLTDVALLSRMSLRASDNRFKEVPGRFLFSGVTYAEVNMTTDNQATHCLLILGPPATRVNTPNTILLQAAPCQRLNTTLDKLFG